MNLAERELRLDQKYRDIFFLAVQVVAQPSWTMIPWLSTRMSLAVYAPHGDRRFREICLGLLKLYLKTNLLSVRQITLFMVSS
jgi:hypothetical protein